MPRHRKKPITAEDRRETCTFFVLYDEFQQPLWYKCTECEQWVEPTSADTHAIVEHYSDNIRVFQTEVMYDVYRMQHPSKEPQ